VICQGSEPRTHCLRGRRKPVHRDPYTSSLCAICAGSIPFCLRRSASIHPSGCQPGCQHNGKLVRLSGVTRARSTSPECRNPRLYAPRPNQSDRHYRYVWQPDLATPFAVDDALPDRHPSIAVPGPSERSSPVDTLQPPAMRTRAGLARVVAITNQKARALTRGRRPHRDLRDLT
jgi:hypothetical protein